MKYSKLDPQSKNFAEKYLFDYLSEVKSSDWINFALTTTTVYQNLLNYAGWLCVTQTDPDTKTLGTNCCIAYTTALKLTIEASPKRYTCFGSTSVCYILRIPH